jgi:anti-sigma regulatory factor (Ser/Thr protein kinase)
MPVRGWPGSSTTCCAATTDSYRQSVEREALVAALRGTVIQMANETPERQAVVPSLFERALLGGDVLIEPGAPVPVPFVGLRLPAVAASVPRARHRLRAFAASCGADTATQHAIALAVTEAVANAVLHAYAGRAAGRVLVDADFEEAAIEITVTDHGRGVGEPPAPRPGLGLELVRHHSSGFEVRDRRLGGTEVWMCFRLSPFA